MTLLDTLLYFASGIGIILFGMVSLLAHDYYTKYAVTAALELVGLTLYILRTMSHLIIAILLGPTVLIVGMLVGEGVEMLLSRRWRCEEKVSRGNKIVNSRLDGFD